MIRALSSLWFFRLGSLATMALGTVSLLQAQSPEEVAAPRLSKRDSVVLGVVEDFTELLPISSTGHLIVTQHLLGLGQPPAVGLSIRILLGVLSRRGLVPFACYRGALAAVLLILPF